MARIAGVDLPREKRGEVALTYVYGVGRPTAIRVLSDARVDPNKRVSAWSEEETGRVREILERRTIADLHPPHPTQRNGTTVAQLCQCATHRLDRHAEIVGYVISGHR